MMQIRKAERKQAKLRIGVSGPSGSGKTYSALLIARGLVGSWEKILLIDTENGSGDLYSNLGDYSVITMQAPFTPESYVEAIKAGEAAGMEAIIIDSASHEWDGKGGCLEINDKLAAAKFKGNSWAAWSETTPRHQRFIEAITTSSCHIITSARSKTDTIQTEDKKIKKVGLKEIQREGFEYELTANFTLDRDGHYAIASKDRTGIFISRDPFVISQATGEELAKWNGTGAVDTTGTDEIRKKIFAQLKRLGVDLSNVDQMRLWVKTSTGLELTAENYLPVYTKLLELQPEPAKPEEKSNEDLQAVPV